VRLFAVVYYRDLSKGRSYVHAAKSEETQSQQQYLSSNADARVEGCLDDVCINLDLPEKHIQQPPTI
jgi:hypothetical protein